jgi:hypothetical protein
MKKFLFFSCLMFVAFFNYATSLESAVITYKYLDSSKYEITLKGYRNCSGVSYPNSIPVYATCKTSSIKIALNLNLVSIIDVTPTCLTENKRCNPANTYGTGAGHEEHTFVDTVDFNSTKYKSLASCGEIIFEYNVCCRSGAINTGPGNNNYYNYAFLNRNLAEGNSSPQMMLPPIVRVCQNQALYLNVAMSDTFEHDSISYSFDDPRSAYGSTIAYTGNYFAEKPLDVYYPSSLKYPYFNGSANPIIGIYLNPENGDLICLPTKTINTVAVIKLTEWKMDTSGKMQIAGIVRQDLQIAVNTCPDNNPPTINGPYNYKVCAGEKICFNVTTDDKVFTPPPPASKPPADTVSLVWNHGIKNATFNIIDKKALHQTGQFCWTPKLSDASSVPYQFVAEARDNACPINAVSRRAFQITVNPKVELSIDKQHLTCNTIAYNLKTKFSSGFLSYTVKLKDSTFSYISDSRLAQFNSTNNVVSNSLSDSIQFYKKGKYFIEYLVNDKNKSCPTLYFDTVVIDDDFANFIELEDTFYCAGSQLNLAVNSAALVGFKDFKWHTGNQADTLTSIALKLSEPFYQLRFTATDQNGCTHSDFVRIDRVDLPLIDLGNDTFIGAKNQLLFKGPAQPKLTQYHHTYLWHDASTTDSFKTTQPQTVILTVANVCGTWSDTVSVISINQLLQPMADVHFCNSDTVSIQSQLVGYNYFWQNAGLGNTYSTKVTAPGKYNCNIILNSGDTLIETIVVVEEKKPSIQLQDTIQFCEGTSFLISPGSWDQYTQITWNDNSLDSIKITNKPGKYLFTANNICGVFSDSIMALEIPLPKVDLGPNRLHCDSFSQSFDFSKTPFNYLWNDNSQSKQKTITKQGEYWVNAYNNCGSVYDTIMMALFYTPKVNLGNDTALKLPFTILLDAGNNGANFLWNNNGTSRVLTVSSFGTYWVKVSTPCGVSTDSITITDAANAKNTKMAGVRIYPNPTTGKINIHSQNERMLKIQIINVLGEVVLSKELLDIDSYSSSIDMENAANGIYTIKVFYTNGSFGWFDVLKEN